MSRTAAVPVVEAGVPGWLVVSVVVLVLVVPAVVLSLFGRGRRGDGPPPIGPQDRPSSFPTGGPHVPNGGSF